MSRPPRPTSSSRSTCSGGVFDWDVALRKLDELTARVDDPTLWDRPAEAQAVSRERSRLADAVGAVQALERERADALDFAELAELEGDQASGEEAGLMLKKLKARAGRLELEALLSGEADGNDAYVEINSGAGGTESADWALMLLRMYSRWAERRGFSVEIDEATEGQEAGLLSSTFIVTGRFAYGWLSAERGVHRLVRISPFDSQARRQTSFASLDVTPLLDDSAGEVEIDEKDLRVDTFRSSGAGGQHINKTDSAIRITHLPTGIVVTCQNERSQHQNRARAMQILEAKLSERARAQRQAEMDALSGNRSDNAWGSQIRSYVQAPYQLVKDHRSEYETGNVDAVLDGDLDGFMEAELRRQRSAL